MRNIKKAEKDCPRCGQRTSHRFVKNQTNGYYSCVICLENHSKKHRKRNWYAYLAQKANSRKRPGSEHLTKEIIEKIAIKQGYLCALTSLKLDVNSKWWKPSLDRIDSSVGYTQNNIRIVAWIVNHSKGSLTDNEFINMCNKVASNFHKYPYSEHCILNDTDY